MKQFEPEATLDYLEASLVDLGMLWYSSQFVFYTVYTVSGSDFVIVVGLAVLHIVMFACTSPIVSLFDPPWFWETCRRLLVATIVDSSTAVEMHAKVQIR